MVPLRLTTDDPVPAKIGFGNASITGRPPVRNGS